MKRDELIFEWSIVDGLYRFENDFVCISGCSEKSRDLISQSEEDGFDEDAYYCVKMTNQIGWGIIGTFIDESTFEAVAFSPEVADIIWPN